MSAYRIKILKFLFINYRRVFPLVLLALLFQFCEPKPKQSEDTDTKVKNFVKTKGMHFERDGKPYHYLGANFWYGINLGSNGAGGDQKRLMRELDAFQKLEINNLRILALSEGPDTEPFRMVPAVQTAPGVFNEDLLQGLDFLLVEMAKRNMTAVVCLGDFWPWSGGFGQYMVWSGSVDSIPYPPPNPGGSWDTYQKFSAKFYSDPKAVKMYWDAAKKIVCRTNTITKSAYTEDPTIMAWQLGNEPRGLNNLQDFNIWIDSTAALLKSWDKNHLVNVGSEGYTPYIGYAGTDMIANHDGPNIDYTTAHIWVQNWDWYNPLKHKETYDSAVYKMKAYLQQHIGEAKKLNKPLVIEEFGIARDSGSYSPTATTHVRDQYYGTLFEEIYKNINDQSPMAGVNFWAWAGEGRPNNVGGLWKPGNDFIGDPPHEFQGWYSVYNADSSTQRVIKEYATKLNQIGNK